MAYERRSAAPASFEPAVRGAPELPGRGARSAARAGRAGAAYIGGTGAARPS